jgi:hypothetical protein
LKTEEREVAPYLVFTITDETGFVVKRINTSASEGINRINWDLRYDSPFPVNLSKDKFDAAAKPSSGLLAMPGNYKVSLSIVTREGIKELVPAIDFNTTVLNNTTLPAANRKDIVDFQKKAVELARVVMGTQRYAEELVKRVEYIKQALNNTPSVNPALLQKAFEVAKDLDDVLLKFNGQPSKASAEEVPPQPVPLNNRLTTMLYTHWSSTSNVTLNMKRSYDILKEEFPPVHEKIKRIENDGIKVLEAELDKVGASWTPGRLPELK